MIDAILSRSVSGEAAEKLSIRHQPPQAILAYNGKAVWN
ncbi:monothiol bacilliredoxin BrxC family protein [Paenibacillus durus]